MSLAALIAAQRAQHGIPVAVSCRALGVSQAWYHKWRNGDRSPRRKRRAALAATIGYLFAKHKGSYGSPRITADLRALGWRVSKNTVAKLMSRDWWPGAPAAGAARPDPTNRRARPPTGCAATSPRPSEPTCAGAGI